MSHLVKQQPRILKILFTAATDPKSLKNLFAAPLPYRMELYCFCANDALESELLSICREIQGAQNIHAWQVYARKEFPRQEDLANHLFLGHPAEATGDFLLFLSDNVSLAGSTLQKMLACLDKNMSVAGVNPQLLATWTSIPRVAFMGITVDCQKQLHYLYEGCRANDELAQKNRFFQLANPSCVLLRAADFHAAGGLEPELGFLAFPSLCLKIAKLHVDGFICLAQARGEAMDRFASWDFCGLWNSILQRGRLNANNIHTDYPKFCQEDNLGYTCDDWLKEGPDIQQQNCENEPDRQWLAWRHHPNPANLLAYLVSLPKHMQFTGLEMARNRPASLPGSMAYYVAQAKKIANYARQSTIPSLAGAIDAWFAKSRRFHYGLLKPGMKLLKNAGIYACSLETCPAIYDAWIELKEEFEHLEPGCAHPKIAIVMPVWNPEPDFLVQAIDSARHQTYPDWQLCIADDASTDPEIRQILASLIGKDNRIRVTFRESNGHISIASNSALELVDAPFTTFLDHDDLLAPQALEQVACHICKNPAAAYLYSDEDHIDGNNVRRTPVFRPDFDCDLMATGHLSTYATSLLRSVGGLRAGLEGAQDQDLQFRVTELLQHNRIVHIPHILYHWRVHEKSTAGSLQAKPYILEATKRMLLDAATRKRQQAQVLPTSRNNYFRTLYKLKSHPACSVVILLDRTPIADELIISLEKLNKAASLEIILKPLAPGTGLPDLPKGLAGTLLPFSGDNIAEACNSAAGHINGEIGLFLAGDLVPATPCRLEQLLVLAERPDVAMAGGNLWQGNILLNGGWYPNRTGLPFRLLAGVPDSQLDKNAWSQFLLPRHTLGASWRCMAVASKYLREGRFLEPRSGSLAPVDYAIRHMQNNRYVVITPWVNWQLATRPTEARTQEMDWLTDKWGSLIATCGLRNSNLEASANNEWTLML